MYMLFCQFHDTGTKVCWSANSKKAAMARINEIASSVSLGFSWQLRDKTGICDGSPDHAIGGVWEGSVWEGVLY
jgi:hypothetical protein